MQSVFKKRTAEEAGFSKLETTTAPKKIFKKT
jgi:hypothetical protein